MQTILIVDDQPVIRRLLAVTLNKDYRVLEAQDGEGALACIHQHHPRAVLLDVMLPGALDGLQVLDAVKRDPLTRDILVAMVSARGQSCDIEDALRRGADVYFVKPFSPQQVLAWVRSKLALVSPSH
jgi:CheY-like chemotaxis protein